MARLQPWVPLNYSFDGFLDNLTEAFRNRFKPWLDKLAFKKDLKVLFATVILRRLKLSPLACNLVNDMHLFDWILLIFARVESWGYLVLLLISTLESVALVGLLVPGTTVTIVAGLLASEGIFNPFILVAACFAGAVIGDALSYWLGLKGEDYFKGENRLLRRSHLEYGEKFFAKHGTKSVFFGRFIGPLRPLVPFIAGLSGMKAGTFFFWNIVGGALWSSVFVFTGYFFGQFWRMLGAWPGRLGAIMVISLAALGVYYYRNAIIKKKIQETK